MSDPLSLNLLSKGDTLAEGDEQSGRRGVVIDTLPFKKPIYAVQLGGNGGEIVHVRASLTKKGRAGKQFVRVSKEAGGRWAMVPETMTFTSLTAVPATPDQQPGGAPPATD